MVIFKKKPVDHDSGDDVIYTLLNRVRPQPNPIIHTKFGQGRM